MRPGNLIHGDASPNFHGYGNDSRQNGPFVSNGLTRHSFARHDSDFGRVTGVLTRNPQCLPRKTPRLAPNGPCDMTVGSTPIMRDDSEEDRISIGGLPSVLWCGEGRLHPNPMQWILDRCRCLGEQPIHRASEQRPDLEWRSSTQLTCPRGCPNCRTNGFPHRQRRNLGDLSRAYQYRYQVYR